MILFLGLSFGSDSRDLVSYLEPDPYFVSRGIDGKVETLLLLAARNPENGKDQVRQLLAIRKLVADPAQANKDKRVRELLTQIVEGKKGKDRLGFAEEYARRALARLDGKPAPSGTIPKLSLRADAFAWFPKEASLVAAYDLRPVPGVPAADVSELKKLAAKFLKEQKLDSVYVAVEMLGNMRLDRFSVGMAPDPMGGGVDKPNARIFVRCTGKVDHQRLVAFLADKAKVPIIRQDRNPGQEPITFLRKLNQPPVFAVVGDSELLMAGFIHDQGDHLSVLQEMLDARARKRPSVVAGPLAARLKKASPQAFILAAGDLTKELGLGPIGAPGVDGKGVLPKTVLVEVVRKAAGVDLVVDAVTANADDAERLSNEASKVLREAVENIQKEMNNKPDVPKKAVELVTKTLESVKVKAKGTSLRISVHVSNEVMKAVPDLLGKLGALPGGPQPEFEKGPGGVQPVPPPPPAQGQGALGPVPGAVGWRAGVSPVTPWGRVAATAVPRLAEMNTLRAALPRV
jgi:hypothetical protein